MLSILVLGYFLINLGIGFWARLRVGSTGDFLNTGRHLHPAVNTAAFFALWYGSETLFGASSRFVNEGFIGIIEDPLGGAMCLILVGLIFAKKLYREQVLTLGDIFKNRLGPRVEQFSALIMSISFFGYAGAQIVALGIVMEGILDIPFISGMIGSSLIVIVYTFLGGMWAVSMTDFIQSIMIVVGLSMVAYITWTRSEGIIAIWESIPTSHKQILPEKDATSSINWLSAWMVLGLGSIFSQDIFQRINSARSEQVAVWSSILGGILYLVLSILPIFILVAASSHPDWIGQEVEESALSGFVKHEMPIGVQALFFGAVLSAVMSTCSGALLAPAGLISENIIKPHWQRMRQSPHIQLWVTKLSVVFCGAVALGLAIYRRDIFDLVAESSIISLVSISSSLTAILFFNYNHKLGVLSSMIGGLLTWGLFEYAIEIPIAPLVPGLLVSILLLLVVPRLPNKL